MKCFENSGKKWKSKTGYDHPENHNNSMKRDIIKNQKIKLKTVHHCLKRLKNCVKNNVMVNKNLR